MGQFVDSGLVVYIRGVFYPLAQGEGLVDFFLVLVFGFGQPSVYSLWGGGVVSM